MSDRSRKLTKLGVGPSTQESGQVPKFREPDGALAYRPTVPAAPLSTPPSGGRKTAAYDSFVDAKERENIDTLVSEPPKRSDPARALRTSVRRTEPPEPLEPSSSRSAKPSVRRSDPPDDPRSSRSAREAISVEELGPVRGATATLPPGARPQLVRRSKSASPPLNARDAHVLVFVDGSRSVKEIVDASKLRPQETAAALLRLARFGIIVI